MILDRGRIVAEDTTEGLTSTLQGGMRVRLEFLQALDGASNMLAGVSGVRHVTRRDDGLFDVACEAGVDCRTELAALAVNAGWGLLRMEMQTMSLEEVLQDAAQQGEAQADSVTAAGDGPKQRDLAS